MRKKNYYLVLDTETCTLPFVKDLKLTPLKRKEVAIMKPIIYDIGWIIMDRMGNIVKEVSYLVQETFFVPSVFNTAYYKEKRPLYIDRLNQGLIKVKNWEEIALELEKDLSFVTISSAYNACFDFKKAIPFTEKYIKALYSNNFDGWLENQKKSILQELKNKNEEYLTPTLKFRNNEYPIVDLWGESVDKLLNNSKYKKMLLESNNFTKSTTYYKTSAETSFQFLINNTDFVEEHTALSDAKIEGYILTKILKKGGVTPNIEPFPFRKLGSPLDDCNKYKGYTKYRIPLLQALEEYILNYEKSTDTNYYKGLINKFDTLCFEWDYN